MFIKAKPYLIIALLTIFSTLIIWIPFILHLKEFNGFKIEHPGFYTVLSHWDGPLYIIPAKTFYNTNSPIFKENLLGLSKEYFAAHMPLYPLTFFLFSPFIGFVKAPVFSTLLFSIFLFWFFYYFVKNFNLSKNPLFLTFIFMFLTPRFLVVRSVGSPEPLFMLLILMSVYFGIKEKYFFSGLLGGLAATCKSPAILLFGSYVIYYFYLFLKIKKIKIEWFWSLLIPLGLLSVFTLYYFQYGDFFAYFTAETKNNLKLIEYPFSVFNFQKMWVGTAWVEEIVFVYFFYLMAIFEIKGKEYLKSIFFFMIVFFIAIISVGHRDISRYSLPMLPFAAIAFEKYLTSKKFLTILVLLLPALFFYAINFTAANVAPIVDWKPFL